MRRQARDRRALAFGILYGFVILRHSDQRILHIGVTDHPSAAWAAQQLREAFDDGPRYVLGERDSLYSKEFSIWASKM